jgi:hypothetical protein
MGIALPWRLALQARTNCRRGFEDLRIRHIADRSTAAVAGVDELDRAHRGAQRQGAHLEQAVGIRGRVPPGMPGDLPASRRRR